MAARLFSHLLLRQLQQKTHLQRLHFPWRNTVCLQQLHVKTFDKDAKDALPKLQNNVLDDTALEEVQEITAAKTATNVSSGSREQEYFIAATQSADSFDGGLQHNIKQDAADLAEQQFIQYPSRRYKKLRNIEYARLIKEQLNKKQLREAIDILEQRMLKEERAKPDNYIYNLLISGCAKQGYTRKAFTLFNKMRQRGLKPKESTYTSLFNACANAPSAADGLARANQLREIMLEKCYQPNVKNYNAMIKAYGRCGDVQTAYLLADEMLDKQLAVTTETFNFLLQACCSDKQFGYRHALLTWQKMQQHGLQADYYTFNTLLRCVRDCGFGDLQTMQMVVNQLIQNQSSYISSGKPMAQLATNATDTGIATASTAATTSTAAATTTTDIASSLQLETEATELQIPNLLAKPAHLGSMLSLSEIKTAHDRFLLLGGLNGFLQQMKQRHITPDIETFTAMLEVIPPTNAAEKQLLTYVRKIGLKADIDFFNILIKKRSMRFDYESAREVLTMIATAGLYPDIVTYGVLALGCQTVEAAKELLEEMRQKRVRMNIQILGAMLRQGCANTAFPYVTQILQISLDENIKPNDIFLRHLDKFYTSCARAIDARHSATKRNEYKHQHAKFCDKLRLFYEEHGLTGLKLEDAIAKIKERPYAQYKEDIIEGIEPLKNEKQARKQKFRKYIKKIKIQNLRDDETASTNEQLQIAVANTLK